MKSKFQLTYLTFTDKQKKLGHSCIGITEIKEDGTRNLTFRVGLFPTNQVEIEDFIKNKPGRNFEERSFDITQEQLTKVLQKINQDRMLDTPDNTKRSRQPETQTSISTGQQSTPRGPVYSLFNCNCKDYALSLVRAAGINDSPLRNLGISIPFFSGKLNRVILAPDKQHGVIKLEKPEESRRYIEQLINFFGKIHSSCSKSIKRRLNTLKSSSEPSTKSSESSNEDKNSPPGVSHN